MDFFGSSRGLRNDARMRDADAGVLAYISEGAAAAQANVPSSNLWTHFFVDLRETMPVPMLKHDWGIAEQAGVDYGNRLADQLGDQKSGLYFVMNQVTDRYREGVRDDKSILVFGVPDPRRDFRKAFVAGVCVEAAYYSGIAAPFVFGECIDEWLY